MQPLWFRIKPMSARSRDVKTTRLVVALLLALLLNVNAHVFTHLSDSVHLPHTVASSEDGKSNRISPFGNHDCLACQSFQHLRPSAAVTSAPLVIHEETIVTRRDAFLPSYNPALATSDRAPPFV